MTTGMIIGRRRWRVVDPAADDPADDLLELVGVVDALARRPASSASMIGGLIVVEDRVVLGEAAGVDLGAAGRPCR